MPPQQPQPDPAFVQQPLTEIWFDTTGGVNSFDNPAYLQENEAAYLQSADIDKRGIRSRRHGCYSFGGPYPDAGAPHGFGVLYSASSIAKLLGIWGRFMYTSDGDGVWLQSATGYTLGGTNAAGIEYEFVSGKAAWAGSNHTVFACGIEPDNAIANSYAPLATLISTPLGGATLNISLCPATITWYQGRLWAAGGTVGGATVRGNSLIWSDIFDGGAWDFTRTVWVDAGAGDKITKLLPARSDTPRLYIFKTRSIWAFDIAWGSTNVQIPTTENTIDTVGSQLRQISENYGTVAPRSVCYVGASRDSDVFFLSRDGVRSMRRVEQDVAGGAGAPVSDPIADVIDSVNWAYAYKAAAEVWDNKYFLALPVSGASLNNIVVVYDLLQKRWIGTQNLDVTAFSAGYVTQGLTVLSGTDSLYFQGSKVLTHPVLEVAASAVSMAAMYQYDMQSVWTDPGATSVVYQEDSRGFAFGDYGRVKSWDLAEYIFDAPSTAVSFAVYAKVDESYWALIKEDSIAAGTSLPTIPQSTGWSAVTTPFQHKQIGLTMCPPGHQIQLRLVSPTQAAFGIRGLRVRAWPQADLWTGA